MIRANNLKLTCKTLLLCVVLVFGCGKATVAPPHEITEREIFNGLRIYQVMVEAFMDGDPDRNYNAGYGPSHHRGDIKGITKALPYIKDLGMNAVWLTPIFDSETDDKSNARLDATGYFTRNYFRIDPNFGTLADAKEMVDKAHELGIYVFLDGVFGHHKGSVPPSPNGNRPEGSSRHVSYPQSLDFYKEVATYWIDELDIDGWRLDQAYQVPVQYWKEIREAVETKCREREEAGRKWGTLGYMVAELWKESEEIARTAYGTEELPGLYSAFDFPMRYRLVQALAVEEKGLGHKPATVLNEGYASHSDYPAHAIPNLMLTNHDLVRFGDLVERAGYGGKENPDYWKRHKGAFAFMAAYTGPITIYYGDEIGFEVEGFAEKVTENCVDVDLCDDHVGRTSGKISGLDDREKNLKNYLKSLMELRETHPALWNGTRTNLIANESIFADLKQHKDDKMVFVLNISTGSATVTIPQSEIVGGRLRDAFANTVFEVEDGEYQIPIDGLTGLILIVE
jgi:glycosidase